MSGWTTITVEPEETVEESFPDYELREDIISKANKLVRHEEPAAGPEEVGLTVDEVGKTLDRLEALVEQAKTQIGEIDTTEAVEEWLRDWSSDFWVDSDDTLISWASTPTVQYPSRGQALPGSAEEILKECPYAKRVLVIHANDTSDRGAGYLYEIQDGYFTKVDEWQGYEGAVGKDVEGYFREEHGISGVAQPF